MFNKHTNTQQKIGCFLIINMCISISFFFPVSSSSNLLNDTELLTPLTGYNSSLLIEPGEDYILEYNPISNSFSKKTDPLITLFSDTIKNAIVKSPTWLEESLILQFQALNDPLPYATLINNASRQYTDEIVFCIAHAPLGNPPDPLLISKNVEQLYNSDLFVSYADIIDIDNSSPDYYSTLRYSILCKNKTINRILPRDIYYWYIVHPQILREKPRFIYGKFWRDYLLYHNDIGYPLLLEKIDNISFLWDQQSYTQPANRNWQECITLHSTAIEALSYWIGKTVPFQATGDRPGQPNLIAHQHNGWCGELQRIAVAGLRSVLIPSISVCNFAEDHVWREFYDNGWHQNDNWWSDGGGTVDISKVYSEGWGKDMSSVFNWRGDGVITDVTSRYINSNDTVNISFNITDIFRHPIDGARVSVFVKGIKDISWHKNQVIKLLDSIMENIPDVLKKIFFNKTYNRIIQHIENISDVIDGLTISIWNYTNADGVCSFTLGRNDEYVFLIQKPNDYLPFPLASWSTVRWIKNPVDTYFPIRFPMIITERKPVGINEVDQSNSDLLSASVKIKSDGIQYQKNVRNNNIGQKKSKCPISFFILTKENYNKYVNEEEFESIYYKKDVNIFDTIFVENETYYFIVSNPSQKLIADLDIQIILNQKLDNDIVTILKPSTTLFSHPHFQVGERITITGFSSDQTNLYINNLNISLPKGSWKYVINTSLWNPGTYTLTARCNTKLSEKPISLIDSIPPSTLILSPQPNYIIQQGEPLVVNGISSDNHNVNTIMIGIDKMNWKTIQDTSLWMETIDTAEISPGLHQLSVKTIDENNNQQLIQQEIIINDTTYTHKPSINSIEYNLSYYNNETIITIYTNISTDNMYPLKELYIEFIINNGSIKSNKLYDYAQHPIQPRHPEDPKKNQSNNPIYGCELGRFQMNKTIQIRVIAIDVAANTQKSSWIKIQ